MPNNTDTDGDGVNDKDEFTRGSDPLAPDTDLDGLSDLVETNTCLLYTSPSPRDLSTSRMPSSA